MKWVAALAVLASVAAPAFAQAPIEPPALPSLPAPASCGDALLISADTLNFTNAPGGRSGIIEWLHCDSLKLSYSLGLSSHSVADSKWRLARVGGTFRPRPELIFHGNANLGSGDSAGGNFDYLSLTVGMMAKAAERLYLKADHQSFHIAASRGNLVRLAGILTIAPTVMAEINVARSFDSNFSIRTRGIRVDWDGGTARPFAGATYGRQIPQAFEAAAGVAADFATRQWFTGVSVPFRGCDWIVAFDYQRGEATSRRTFTAALRFAFK